MATVVLGVCGSIAACKATDVASRLTKAGHEVHCVCTPAALHFVSSLTLMTLSRHRVISTFEDETTDWVPAHIALAQKADVLAVAPVSANTLACFAQGLAPNVLTSLYLATRAPVLLFPAMNTNMWEHPATRRNVQELIRRGNSIIGPAEDGELACGTCGKGRMVEIDCVVAHILKYTAPQPNC